jgi:hypothetical protein
MKNAISQKSLAIGIISLLLGSVVSNLNAGWVNVTSNLAGMGTECGNVYWLDAVPGKDKVIVGIAQKGLWATTNGGAAWVQLGQGAGSATITNRPSLYVFDPLNSDIFYESGIYNGAGCYKTTDGGNTFQALGNTYHCDGMGVDFTDPQRQTLLAGAHESSQKVWKSVDGGSTWTNVGTGLPSGNSLCPFVVNAQTFLVNLTSGSAGIYRTTNGGSSWTQVSSLVGDLNLLKTSDGQLYWGLRNGGIAKGSADGGTWTSLSSSGAKASTHPIELPGGRIATIGSSNIRISGDQGATWKSVAGPLPISNPFGIAYNSVRGCFFVYYWDCGSSVPSNAVWRYDTLIASGTEITNPGRSTAPHLNDKPGLPQNAMMFDLMGRNIDRNRLNNHGLLRATDLYFVKVPNGTTAKRICRE